MFGHFHWFERQFPHLAWAGGHPQPDRGFLAKLHLREHRGGPRGGWGDEPRRPRGEIKFILLELLCERPQHGYELIKELENRQGGFRRFSPGSVYPTLQMLEEGGYLTSKQVDDKRVYTITDNGKQLLSDRPQRRDFRDHSDLPGKFPQEKNEDLLKLRKSLTDLNEAVMVVARSGNSDQTNQVRELIVRLKREIYKILGSESI